MSPNSKEKRGKGRRGVLRTVVSGVGDGVGGNELSGDPLELVERKEILLVARAGSLRSE